MLTAEVLSSDLQVLGMPDMIAGSACTALLAQGICVLFSQAIATGSVNSQGLIVLCACSTCHGWSTQGRTIKVSLGSCIAHKVSTHRSWHNAHKTIPVIPPQQQFYYPMSTMWYCYDNSLRR